MSVELQKLRGELLREALLKGWTQASQVPEPWVQQLPRERIERWYRRLYKSSDEVLPVGQRLVNHFMLGADPEFVFHDGVDRHDARSVGLKAGPAFGADNNGRLVELRPAPSRSALSVLASMWLAMRWMAVYHPDTLALNWRSGAYYGGDGLGGHVHFGRKRDKLREREVSVLDRITHLQFVAGIFDREEGRLRVRQAQGAPSGQPYGALSDVRRQPHGYEYRTLPSWIDNAWLAYFNLVVAKLCVAFPDLVPPLLEADADITPEQARQQLRMLLAYYSPTDDDARLASAILAHKGLPRHCSGMDFKNAWGLFASGPLGHRPEATPTALMPETIPSRAEDEQELALSMFEGRPPELTPLVPTWPSSLPAGYSHVIRHVDTKLSPGLGELAMGMVMHRDCIITFQNCGHRHQAFRFPAHLQTEIIKKGLGPKMGVPIDCPNDDWLIYINATKDYDLEQLMRGREAMLDSQIFPLWRPSEVKPDSITRWMKARDHESRGPKTLYEGSQ